MLREARIVMPHFQSVKSHEAHLRLRNMLCEAFGGFTAFDGQGGWRDPSGKVVHDNVTIYDVAMDGSRTNGSSYDTLIGIAVDAGRALDQQEVYVRYCNGNVDLIKVLSDEERHDKQARLLQAVAAGRVGSPVRMTEPDDQAGAMRLLEAIFGEGNVIGNVSFIGDDSAELPKRTASVEKHKPHPGQMWKTRGGGKAFVGRRATVHEGGWYATLVETQAHYRAGFEYVVDFDGYLAGHREIGDSSLDLVSILG
jgi:hypothetical protein